MATKHKQILGHNGQIAIPSSTGGLKADGGKPRLDLLSTHALNQIALVLNHGAEKYDEHNWRKGIEFHRLIRAALNHVMAFNAGEDNDPESGLSHLAHAGCCVMFLLELLQTHPELDDRYVTVL